MSADPIQRFQESFARAQAAAKHDPCAMSLATADASGAPSVRMVLLRGADARGFVFYTNRDSRKGDELKKNPRAALCIYWPDIEEQVRIEGAVELVSDEESNTYFAGRPRESQLGAWASRQSRPLEKHALLGERFADLTEAYAGREVPRPRWWGGYRIVPSRIEFWHAGKHRLHERTMYERLVLDEVGPWVESFLNP